MSDQTFAAQLAAAQSGDREAFGELTEPFRRALLTYCYRLLGSLEDAEDLVQDVLLRAWLKIDTFEPRGSFRSWLYKIATNACLNVLARSPRRTLPIAANAPADPQAPLAPPSGEHIWLEPFPDDLLSDTAIGPEAIYSLQESVTLAFLVALHLLPPQQRAILILRDVLEWRADEVAQLLDVTVPAVNSALYRARVTLEKHYHPDGLEQVKAPTVGKSLQELLERYIHAWENANIAALVALLKEDATFSMPPLSAWFQGREAVSTFLAAVIFRNPTPGLWHLLLTHANGRPAFGVYQRGEPSGGFEAFGIAVVTLDEDKIAGTTVFMQPSLCARFGLPLTLPA